MTSAPLGVLYFSDVLCVWAYSGQIRLDELRKKMGDKIHIQDRFLNIYGDVPGRIQKHTGDADEPARAYAERMRGVAARFDHTKMSERCFTEVQPKSSNQAHLLLCAVRSLLDDEKLEVDFTDLVRSMRLAFFEQARDIGRLDVLFGLLEEHDVAREPVEALLADGTAMAALSSDLLKKDELSVAGSPTYILDGGREKLFGNVGYRVIEANVVELLEATEDRRGASWC